MRLIWFTLHGYKRFEEPTRVPGFLLDADDVTAINDLHGAADAGWLIIEKLRNGGFRTGVEPNLKRDLRPRQRAVAALRKLEPVIARAEAKAAAGGAQDEEEEDEDEPLRASEVRDLADQRDVDDETLPARAQSRLAEVAKKLAAEAAAHGNVGRRARAAVDPLPEEEEDHPADIARSRLARRRPRFLPFRDTERTLRTEVRPGQRRPLASRDGGTPQPRRPRRFRSRSRRRGGAGRRRRPRRHVDAAGERQARRAPPRLVAAVGRDRLVPNRRDDAADPHRVAE